MFYEAREDRLEGKGAFLSDNFLQLEFINPAYSSISFYRNDCVHLQNVPTERVYFIWICYRRNVPTGRMAQQMFHREILLGVKKVTACILTLESLLIKIGAILYSWIYFTVSAKIEDAERENKCPIGTSCG